MSVNCHTHKYQIVVAYLKSNKIIYTVGLCGLKPLQYVGLQFVPYMAPGLQWNMSGKISITTTKREGQIIFTVGKSAKGLINIGGLW